MVASNCSLCGLCFFLAVSFSLSWVVLKSSKQKKPPQTTVQRVVDAFVPQTLQHIDEVGLSRGRNTLGIADAPVRPPAFQR